MSFRSAVGRIAGRVKEATHGVFWVGTLHEDLEVVRHGQVLPGLTNDQIKATVVKPAKPTTGIEPLVQESRDFAAALIGEATDLSDQLTDAGHLRLMIAKRAESYADRLEAAAAKMPVKQTNVERLIALQQASANKFASEFQTYRRLILLFQHNKECMERRRVPLGVYALSTLALGSSAGFAAFQAIGATTALSMGIASAFGIGAFLLAGLCALELYKVFKAHQYHQKIANGARFAIFRSNNMYAKSLFRMKLLKKTAADIGFTTDDQDRVRWLTVSRFKLRFDPEQLLVSSPYFRNARHPTGGADGITVDAQYITAQLGNRNIASTEEAPEVQIRNPLFSPLQKLVEMRLTANL